jgi:hypothetical protein
MRLGYYKYISVSDDQNAKPIAVSNFSFPESRHEYILLHPFDITLDRFHLDKAGSCISFARMMIQQQNLKWHPNYDSHRYYEVTETSMKYTQRMPKKPKTPRL